MKSSMATALSVTGILAAGGIALAANTNLLDGGVSTVKGSPARAAAVVTTSTLPGSETPSQGAASGTQTTLATGGTISAKSDTSDPNSTDTPSSPDTTIPDSSTDTTYTVPGVGNVTVTVTDGVMSVSYVSDLSGWSHTIRPALAGRGYDVTFVNSSTGTTYEFHVALIDGRVVTSIEDVTDTPTPPTPPNYGDDDDDDDDYEHHDDGHEDHEDHEDEDDD